MPTEPAPPPPPVDPRRTKRRALWFAIGIGLVVLIILSIAIGVQQFFKNFESLDASQDTTVTVEVVHGTGSDKIALIKIHGQIVTEDSEDPSLVSSRTMKRMLKTAKDDTRVKAVILDIDSPGGSVVASSQIYDALKDLQKPIVALYSGELAASGGLYVSMGADKIVSYPETLTGSIGVIAEFVDISALMDKYGVKVNVIKSGNFKDVGSYARPMTETERSLFQELIDESYNRFIQLVADNRHLSIEQVKTFADGRIYSGTKAKEFGMVDSLGDFSVAEATALELAKLKEAQIIEYRTESPFSIRSLFGLIGKQLHGNDALATLGLLSENHRKPSMQLYYLAK